MNSPLKTSSLGQLSSLSREQWLSLGLSQAPRIVAGLAVIGIAAQAAQLTWLMLTPKAEISAGSAPVVVATPAARTAAVNTQTIADAHLFGIASAGPTAADPSNLPQTQMSLVLAGTIAFNDPEAGYAIVGENAANAKFYKVGATINGAARLHAVYSDRVTIERNGTLETLVLPRGPSLFAPSPAPPPNVNNNTIAENVRRIANNPSALGQLLRAQPVFTNGVQKGYRVYPSRDRAQFAKLGLQPGDLITAVNGTPLDDPNRSGEILNTMTSSSSVNVTVERSGATQNLTLDIAQISLPDTSSSSSENTATPPEAPPADNPGGPARNRDLRNPIQEALPANGQPGRPSGL